MTRLFTSPARAAMHQAGMSLISVLVAIVVFSLGMLSIASLYSLAVPAVTSNQYATDTAAFGNQFWALVQANPAVVGQLAAGTSTYTSSTSGSAPPALQPFLANVFSNPATMLPNAKVTITPGPDAQGNACSAASCGLGLQIQWSNVGGANSGNALRTQNYNFQLGF
ncbi:MULTISPECIES: prepilin-type N-terminal cleavage/methylation domain-containing protein [unclassified Thiomonas]|uniref:type IV pilus modification PilV family protein n=1 Tax=unclassified Thiomonas TaxID=2625466 RepID=UPI0004DB99DD|nr:MULTISPECIES: prepilin-type N-terminal cleavage/methylation domain-containing protein [unclassified Thiomonas]MDD4880691.1 prepilin-type N-terminal cleavage/methylation domain-containing protein [Gallionellaceae bacterium]CQR44080.1 putative Tfp pilus assembly protein PilV [Thiomonas sp. CB3]CDW94422.1 putative Tfp pilus assembly protein PilV [Thiomonas sp. CB2]VDY06071.1 putative Tfp pilus assembly protein PilV [Thiomonas sp. Bio17B3]VDY10631.1 putative Tfp pilus assembly protein PilV [Thi